MLLFDVLDESTDRWSSSSANSVVDVGLDMFADRVIKMVKRLTRSRILCLFDMGEELDTILWLILRSVSLSVGSNNVRIGVALEVGGIGSKVRLEGMEVFALVSIIEGSIK